MKKILGFIVSAVVVVSAIFGIGSFVKNYNKEESFKNNLEQQVNGVFKDWFNKSDTSTDENPDLSGDVNGSVDLPNTGDEDTSAVSSFSFTLTDEQLSRIQAGAEFYCADGVEYATWSEYIDVINSGCTTWVNNNLDFAQTIILFNLGLSINWDEIPYSEVCYITYLTIDGVEHEVTWTRTGTKELIASSYPSIFSYFHFSSNMEIRISFSDMIKSISLDRIVYVPNNNEILYENN